jgi:hypothetical protein
MSNLIFDAEVKALIRSGIPREYAILTASSKLEDKTLFNQQLKRMQEENDVIREQMELKGFRLSTDIIDDEPTNNEIQNIQHNQP